MRSERLSRRIVGINAGGSDGWEVHYRARRLRDDGVRVTTLDIGEHDIRTDPAILDAMRASAEAGNTGYAPIPGTASLRRAIAKRAEERTGVPTSTDNVLVTPGGQAALFACHHAVLDEGDRAAFVDPHYATYPGTIRALGGVPAPVRAQADDGFSPSAESLASIPDDAVSLLVNTPNNPTGAVYSRNTLEGLADICVERDLWLVSDEVYETQVWDGEHVTPRSLPGMAERTLVVGSMSKSHAMTGSRCGWVIGPEDVISRLADLATNTTYGVPGFVQDAATLALELGPEIEERVAAPFRRRRGIVAEILGTGNAARMVASKGAMYAMVDVRPTGLSGKEFAWRLLEERRISVMPGESFGAAAAGHVRVAMTVADAEFADAIETLRDFAACLAS